MSNIQYDLEGIEISDFKPCVVENEPMRLTEMILEDTCTVWCPWKITSHLGHAVDLGYNNEGKLVGIRIWDLVAERK